MHPRSLRASVLAAAALCATASLRAAPFEDDLRVYDRLLAEVQPGQTRVRFGDVGLSVVQLRALREQLVRLRAAAPEPDVVTPGGSAFQWPGGNVYYRFDPTQVGNGTLTAAKQQQFRDSAAEWAAFANLHFIENISGQANFITVKETPGLGGGYSSAVGLGGGEQTLEFDPQAWNRYAICHEIGHALGLWHEMQRADRDTYVVINFSNIPAGQQGNFTIVPGSQTFGTAYDFYSVMHYRRDQFAINPNIDTISMQPAYAQFINITGQVYDRPLSKIERAGMATIYGAPALAPGATVINTNDSGPGSLRSALYYAFDRSTDPVPTPTGILFHISTSDPGYDSGSGVFTIRPTAQLIAPGAGTTIDGATQTAFTGNTNANGPEILIDGSQIAAQNLNLFASGFILREANCALRNLALSGFNTQGVRIAGTSATGNVISGCYLGTDASGSIAVGNGSGWPGIEFSGGAHNNTLGGLTSAERNLISGNSGHGVRLTDSGTANNSVTGNYIGTNAAGSAALSNGYGGVAIENGASNNVIGGASAAARNVISGNRNEGVVVIGNGTNGNSVRGNYIGTNAAGSAALGNGLSSNWAGVSLYNGPQGNFVLGNIISGNTAQGVALSGAGTSNNTVQGNFIGTNPAGSAALPNQWSGVAIFGGAISNLIGGSSSTARNLISGNLNQGVVLAGNGTNQNIVSGNFIGTAVSGLSALPNSYSGLGLFGGAQANRIGGVTPGERNLISGNLNQGVTLSDAGTSANLLQGNYIGLNVNGAAALPNQGSGVDLFSSASGNIIGGTTAGARNFISGNGGSGIALSGGVTMNLVQGNTIGLSVLGASVANAAQGMALFNGAQGNTIGGSAPGASNQIAGNSFEGIATFDLATVGNVISQNSIFANVLRGIGVYSSSAHGAVPPMLTAAVLSSGANPGGTDLSGALNSAAGTSYHLEFFATPGGSDQGKTFLGATDSLTNGSGAASFGPVHLAAAVLAGSVITATATDPGGNTSQFSLPFSVTATDSDGDGLPDNWMLAHFGHATGQAGDLSRADDDADGDGFTTRQEFLAGTDPKANGSALRMTMVSRTANDLVFTFASVAGKTYRIETRDDVSLGNWTVLLDQIVASAGSTTVTRPAALTSPRGHFRVVLLP